MARLLTLVVVLAAPSALACFNSLQEERLESDEVERRIIAANRHFAAHEYDKAFATAKSVFPSAAGKGQMVRAQTVAGLAALKDGDHAIAWEYLSELTRGPGASPYLQAKAAEAAIGAGKIKEGRKTLEALATGDLIPDADSWLALAKARAAEGDQGGADAATAIAKTRAPDTGPELQLELPPPDRRYQLGGLAVAAVGLTATLARVRLQRRKAK